MVIAIVIVSIVSSYITRLVLPYMYNAMNEGFEVETKNMDVLNRFMNLMELVTIKRQKNDGEFYEPVLTRALHLKGGLEIRTDKQDPLVVKNMPYNQSGVRWCHTEPCSDSVQWGLQFSRNGNLLYRSHTHGHMPTKEVAERKRLIMPSWNWYGRVFRNSTEINRPPISRID